MAPHLAAASIRAAGMRLELAGDWSLNSLGRDIDQIRRTLAQASPSTEWNLSAVARLDSFGAILIWRAWGECWPANVSLQPEHRRIIERAAAIPAGALPKTAAFSPRAAVASLGDALLGFVDHALHFVALLGQLFLDCIHLLRHPRQFPLAEVSASVYKVGVKAMPVAAMVGFLIGVVLSYLSSLQLKTFGADIFIINILGLGIIRELGPVLVSVLVAGRSGSAMTAQLGVMRVTEEIDALAALGVSRSQRLVLPKVFALMLAMPLLVLWTSAVALLGGALSAWVELGIAPSFFLETLPRVVPIANLYIGLLKGMAFGLLIALVACHFGLRVQPNTESLSASTTASVVSAITIVILADAAFAIATRTVGVVA